MCNTNIWKSQITLNYKKTGISSCTDYEYSSKDTGIQSEHIFIFVRSCGTR